MEPDAVGDQPQTLQQLLTDGLQAVVFGNGLLIVVILTVFLLTVLLSRTLKGGSL